MTRARTSSAGAGMVRIVVWLTFPDGERIEAGETVCGAPRGAFRYAPAFLEHPLSFPFDPVALPLGRDPIPIERRDGVAGVFEDSLPDAWGRRLLIRRAALPRAQQTLPHLLLALGNTGLGALSFGGKRQVARPSPPPSLRSLASLFHAAQQMERGEEVEDTALAALLAAGSSAGGARPKVLLREGDTPVIAKFPSSRDAFDIVGLEAGTMALARAAGLEVPDCRLVEVGSRRVLLVSRFDVVRRAQGLPVGRRHMVSFQTLLGADDYYHLGYGDLFQVVRRVCAHPEVDVPRLFRQMAFNALVGNRDDHLKNFALLHDDRGYVLSPAYDLLPSVTGEPEHVLHFDGAHVAPRPDGLVAFGRRLGVPSPARIVDEVVEALRGFRDELAGSGVPAEQIDRLWTHVVGKQLGLSWR